MAKLQMSTQKRYSVLLRRFLGWLCLLRLLRWNAELWDVKVALYVEHTFDRGLSIADMLKLPSALTWAVPRLGGLVRRVLPITYATLQGWQKLTPAATRAPLPRMVLMAIAEQLVVAHKTAEALCCVLMFVS